MTTTIHKNLTGSDLHEPKGADTALVNQVYVSNGVGSGTWQTASSIITNQAFTTGDLKPTHKSSADSGWILWSDGTIGDASSGASIRANADTAALYAIYWALTSITTVSSGRGASAVLDYAAHKTVTLPPGAGRALGIVGAGSGLTTRTMGQTVGTETCTLSASQIPTITSSVSVTGTANVSGTNGSIVTAGGILTAAQQGSNAPFLTSPALGATINSSGSISGSGSATSNNTSGAAHSIMNPMAYVNVMIKL